MVAPVFPQITRPPQAAAETLFNQFTIALQDLLVYANDYRTTTGLTWAYFGGRWGGYTVAAGTLSLTDNASNYVVVAKASGAITTSTSTTNWNDTTNYVRVFQLTTASSAVTVVADYRAGSGGVHGGGGGATVSGAMSYKGAINCSANPNYPAADAGHVYIVSVAGKIGGASGTVVEQGDLLVCMTDGTASGTQAAVGANWDVIQTNIVGAALQSLGLSQFASGLTTSAQLAALLSDETGTGVAVFSDSPALTGNPTVPTQTAGNSSTRAANTAFVAAAVAAATTGVSSVAGKTGAVTLVGADITDFTEATQDVVGAFLVAGAVGGIFATYDDAGNAITLSTEQQRNTQTGTTYTLVTGDRAKRVTLSNAAAIALTIPTGGSTGFAAGWWCEVEQLGAGVVTGTPASGTVDGNATVVTVGQATGYKLSTDGANWFTTRGLGSSGGSGVTSVDASGGVETTTGSPITGTGTVRSTAKINAQTGTTYTFLAADRGKHVTTSNAASIAAGIAAAGTTGFEDGFFFFWENIGVGTATLTPSTSTVNGATSLALNQGQAAIVFSDGTNYRALVIDPAGVSVNAQTGTTYTVLSGDRGKLITHSNASAIAVTLPQASSSGAFRNGWFAWVQNRGAGTATYTPATSTIDGAASLALTTGQGVLIASDGTNYYTVRGLSAGGGSLTNFTEAVSTAAPNNATPMVSLTATNAATDASVALVPKGGGTLQAAVSNNLTSGGNARGTYAVDWQLSRTANTQVASGSASTIPGGYGNTANGAYSYCAGRSNSAGAQDSAVLGGTSTSIGSGSSRSIAAGGSNTIGTSATDCVCFGNSGTINNNATYCGVLSGFFGTAGGNYATVLGGISCTSTGDSSATVGSNCTADAQGAFSAGQYATSRGMAGAFAWSSGQRAAKGDAQRLDACLRVQTTGSTQTAMTSNGGAAANTNQFKLPTNSVMKLRAHVTAINRTTNDVSAWEISAVCKNVAGTVSLVGTQTRTLIAQDAGASAWAVNIIADTTNLCIELAATGVAATTIDWSAACSTIITA